jgi:hypothetical protein
MRVRRLPVYGNRSINRSTASSSQYQTHPAAQLQLALVPANYSGASSDKAWSYQN